MCKNTKLIIKVAVFFLMLSLVHSGGTRVIASTDNDPLVHLQKTIDQILVILQSEDLKVPEKKKERKESVLKIVHKMFDFYAMARSSLGQNWNSLTAEEQDRFVDLFASLVELRYIGKIDAYDNQKVIYKDERVRDDRALVYTALIDKDLEIPIDYSLKRSQGKWQIHDLKIENVSLISNYRRDFNSIIRKEQFSGLVKKITEQLEKSEMQD